MTWKAQVGCKVIETHYSIKFLSAIGNLLWCLDKKWVKILIVPLFQLQFVGIVLAFLSKLTSVLSYTMQKFVKIECHLHG